jgi:sporulation protein YlmC with PRC-barrel domain
MRVEQLEGKGVIDSEARVLGYISGLEFDTGNWKITHLSVKLADDAIEDLGFKKPRLGSIVVTMPIEVVKAVRDVIAIDRGIKDLKSVIERRP